MPSFISILPGGCNVSYVIFSIIYIFGLQVGVLNTEGYYSSLLAFFDKAVEEGFVSRDSRKIVVCANEPTELLDKLEVREMKGRKVGMWFATRFDKSCDNFGFIGESCSTFFTLLYVCC